MDRTTALGTARAAESIEVTSRISSTVSEIRFREGQDVAAGALLVQLDNREISAALALGDLLLGKPEDAADARRMLNLLRDGPHQVHSAVSVLDAGDGSVRTAVNSTTVVMRPYTDAEVDAYIASGDPMDKAGGYAIQHPDFAPAAAVEGCLSGVMGLPLGTLADLLAEAGIDLPPVAPVCQRQTSFRCCRADG